jgi:hypothetical protein
MATTRRAAAHSAAASRPRRPQTGPELIEHLFRQLKSAVDKQRAAMKKQRRPVGRSRKTRAELYQIARKRGLVGRSRMSRDELARKLRLR